MEKKDNSVKDLGIKRVYTPKQRKNRTTSRTLFILAVVCLIVGVALLLIEPIKNYRRNKIITNTIDDIKIQMAEEPVSDVIPVYTMVVDKNDNVVNGEEYDYFGTDEEQAEQQRLFDEAMANLPDDVTLTCIGIISIDSAGIEEPIWDNDSVIELRYGTGHHQTSCLPGESGNCTILGHRMRSTGTIFNRLNEVAIGDSINIITIDGSEFVYEVDRVIVIDPLDLESYIDADDGEGSQITLVTCEYTAEGKMRLLVIGHLVSASYSQTYINSFNAGTVSTDGSTAESGN